MWGQVTHSSKQVFWKNHAYKWLQRKKPSTPCDSYINSTAENVYFFHVRNLEGWNHSQHTVTNHAWPTWYLANNRWISSWNFTVRMLRTIFFLSIPNYLLNFFSVIVLFSAKKEEWIIYGFNLITQWWFNLSIHVG